MKTLLALAACLALAGTASATHFARTRAAVIVSPVVVAQPVVVASPVVAGYSACGTVAALVTPQVGTVATQVIAPVAVAAFATPGYGFGAVSAFNSYGHGSAAFAVRRRAFVASRPAVAVRAGSVAVRVRRAR